MTAGQDKERDHTRDPFSECPLKTDPTKNVLDLVHASTRRQDDLMAMSAKRADDLANERVKRLENEQALRADFHDKLMLAEAKRVDAIRATDIAAATLANERATQQADILARQVAQTTETLRTLVDATAKQMSLQHETTSRLMGERVTLLEQKQYEAQGKSVATSPMTEELVKEMRASREYRSTEKGQHAGMSLAWGYILAAIAALASGVAIVLSLQGAFRPPVAVTLPAATVQGMTAEELQGIRDAWQKTKGR